MLYDKNKQFDKLDEKSFLNLKHDFVFKLTPMARHNLTIDPLNPLYTVHFGTKTNISR